ncbi:hypothetical protein DEO72_LG10g2204 [Vigna unguiculata]|uniref:Uncharacterized protein n=1 Tax=Vigna unguiculata TaxID=3917 RepID=A0A4D6NDM2_VIGUN|nr:hypothetical protein DEO72_LG10g2204 [Vigna unguiculata]
MLNPYPELNSRDTFRATTQGTPASQPLRCHRSLVEHAHKAINPMLLQQESLGAGHLAPGASTSRPLGEGCVLLGANALLMPMPAVIAWRDTPHRQAPCAF